MKKDHKLTDKMLEEELRKPVQEFLLKRNYFVFHEVAPIARRIDVVARRGGQLATVELKLKDWKKAIHQAYLNLHVADLSYVALPEEAWANIDPQVYISAIRYGLGLLLVNGRASQILKPRASNLIQKKLRKTFLTKLRMN